MKEFIGLSRNLQLVDTDDGLIAQAEIVLIVSEPHWSRDEAGSLVRSRRNEMLRFSTGVSGANQLAETFLKFASEMESLEKRTKTEAEPPAS